MSSIFTKNFTNPLDFIFDSSKCTVDTSARLNKLPLLPNEISLYTGTHGITADRSIGDGQITLNNNAYLNSITREFVLPTGGSLSIGSGNFPAGYTLTFSAKIKFDFNTNPPSDIYIFSTGDYSVSSGLGSSATLSLLSNGSFRLTLVDAVNGSSSIKSMGSLSVTAGTEYDIELSTDMLTGIHRLFLNGVLLSATGQTVLPFSVRNYFNVGKSASGIASGNFSIRDINLYNNIQHTDIFSDDIPRSLYLYEQECFIDSIESINTDELASLSSVSDTFLDSDVGFYLDVDGTPSYIFGGSLISSDKSFSNSNSVDDILNNLSAINSVITLGSSIKLGVVLTSGSTRKATPVLYRYTMEYSFFSPEIPHDSCVVWGYLKDGVIPVSGGVITAFTQHPVFIDGTLLSINVRTTSRSNGYFELLLPETVSTNMEVNIVFSFADALGKNQTKTISIKVPNSAEARVDTLRTR